jgi:hypothetical protein
MDVTQKLKNRWKGVRNWEISLQKLKLKSEHWKAPTNEPVKGFLIIRLFGNLSDNFIYRGNFSWLSDSQSFLIIWVSRLGKN